ncbi:MAG: hypothetical protein RTU30_06565 [Candidatus Thorarchaeota archaeon]
MTFNEEGTFYHYLVLFLGVMILGLYFYFMLVTMISDFWMNLISFTVALLLVVTTLSIPQSASRSGRTGLTMLSGFLAGIVGYLDLALYNFGDPINFGIVVFAWLAFGILLSFAAFNWLQE